MGRDGNAVPDRGRRPSGAGPGAEAKEGVALEGAQSSGVPARSAGGCDEPGPLTLESASGADEAAPRAPARPTYDMATRTGMITYR